MGVMNAARDARIGDIKRTLEALAPELVPLLGHFLAEADDGELSSRAAEQLAETIGAHARFAKNRTLGEATVKVVSSSNIVQVVTDDMPFLVDSVSMAVRLAGFDVEMLMHPVVFVERDSGGSLINVSPASGQNRPAESWIVIELDRTPSQAESLSLAAIVSVALSDVRAAVTDWEPMKLRAREVVETVRNHPKTDDLAVEPGEAAEFVEWLLEGNFTFIGAIDHDLTGDQLVEVPGSAIGVLSPHPNGTPIEAIISPSSQWPAHDVVLVTKTMAASKVHRQGNYDIIVVKRYNGSVVVGERRLLGLFTSDASSRSPLEVPLLRGKLQTVLTRSGLSPSSYSGKELRSILVVHPRDELFAMSIDELYATALGILSIGERRRTRMFARYDSQRYAWSCQVYMPRDRYTTDVRQRMQRTLEGAFGASSSSYTTQLTDGRLARIVFTVPTEQPGSPDLAAIETQLGLATQSWPDSLAEALAERHGPGSSLAAAFRDAFPPAYTAETPLSQALDDVVSIDLALRSSAVQVRMHRNSSEDVEGAQCRISLYSPTSAIALADLMPVLANIGLRVIDEKADEAEVNGVSVWIHDLGVAGLGLNELDPHGQIAQRVCDGVLAAWMGGVDNDTFNQLVTVAALTVGQSNILRFYARHARQLGLAASLEYVVSAFAEHPAVARLLVARFETMFDPTETGDRVARCAELREEFLGTLAEVPSLDHDRIFRMISAQIDASIRTNAYQTGRPTLAVKFETRRIPDAPQPRPQFEVFVSGPKVEGVHLRMGSVARGGLRWSDRPEDFRTEVLGLMKAQAVKNAVIVPAGAKGGFVVRKPVIGLDRAAQQAEGVSCYQTFIGALLDVTDNVVDGSVVPPADTVRWDSDDPYLVVAADKGTATFSDIANAISLERGHWLGDAFASGGSVGYDHKAMGITARGAWESVKRHFLRLGRDILAPNSASFSVAGVGDMSGDVFGNGMLLSQHIALVAAFDHRHIFLDPSPDTATSFAERARLFALPRSSWDDYDRSLISAGGGVWPRTAKSIPLSVAAQAVLGLSAAAPIDIAPNDLLAAILRAPVDLLWNGGIGTYIKASTETHSQVGDKANDSIRADATELRCAMIGEGGNLGVTQRGRIEFAHRLRQEPVGTIGWVNTDAIDNSAGVDTSDHEVNLKILLDQLVREGAFSVDARNELLAQLTDEVASHVLADNIDQNRLLGNLYAEGPGMIDLHARYVAELEALGRIDRALEALPSAAGFVERKAGGSGLTIPELAVLVAHTKLAITEALVDAKPADDPAFATTLRTYFPSTLLMRLGDRVLSHPLRHEVLATVLANRVVNRNGITFVYRMAEETHASVIDIVRAHTVATEILGVDSYWSAVSKLDGKVADADSVQLFLEADRAVERVARWLLRSRTLPLDVPAAIAAYGPALVELGALLDGLQEANATAGSDAEALVQRTTRFAGMGLTQPMARQAAQFEFATSLLDVVSAADATGHDRIAVGGVLLALDDLLLIGRLRRRILRLPREDQWDALARSSLRDDLAGEHVVLTRSVLAHSATGSPEDRVRAWMTARQQAVTRHLDLVSQTDSITGSELAALSVVLRQLRTLSTERTG
jgi:glutamate dehydrogenase